LFIGAYYVYVIAIIYVDDKGAFVYIGVGPKTLTAVCYGADV